MKYNVKKSNWFGKLKGFILGALLEPLFKKADKKDILMDTEKNDKSKKNRQPLDSPLDLDDLYSTRDKTPLSFNTLAVIALFKNGTKILETPQNGCNFEKKGLRLDKLTRYQVLINFLIEHKEGEELPEEKFIVENCMYKNEKLYSRKIVKKHKADGAEIGDLYQQTIGGKYYLSRLEKY